MQTSSIRWSTVIAIGSTLMASCADDLYVKFEHVELRDQQRIAAGEGCALAIEGRRLGGGGSVSSGSADASGDFVVEEQSGEEAYLVVVRSQGGELVHREYDEPFLRSGAVDRFEVTTRAGRRFELAYRGSRSCESPSFEE
jgi:hypothetical protein